MEHPTYYASQEFGGSGGSSFDDTTGVSVPIVGIQSITICSNDYVNGLQVTYLLANGKSYQADFHGGNGGTEQTISFAPGERIIALGGRSGRYVDQLMFLTSKPDGTQRVYGTYGGSGGDHFFFNGDILGFFGRGGSSLDAIGFYVNAPMSPQFGGSGGDEFEDSIFIQSDRVVGIQSITIRSGTLVDGLQVTYLLANGKSYHAGFHGGNGGTEQTISFAPGERIIALVGRAGRYVDQLTFLTSKPDGTRETYGPYGGNGGDQFILNSDILGFFGRDGNYLDAIGAFENPRRTADITVVGEDGYYYCLLQSYAQSKVCTVPVIQGATDLCFRFSDLDDLKGGVGFVVTDPQGTKYSTGNDGTGPKRIWSVPAANASLGLLAFYIPNPDPGTWQVTASVDPKAQHEPWAILGTTNPMNASAVARSAFDAQPIGKLEQIHEIINPNVQTIPPEFCYFCQAQMYAIAALALATFVFWAGPVVATSAIVLYAQRLLPTSVAKWVTYINSAYGLYSAGGPGSKFQNIARYICEKEGFCSKQTDE